MCHQINPSDFDIITLCGSKRWIFLGQRSTNTWSQKKFELRTRKLWDPLAKAQQTFVESALSVGYLLQVCGNEKMRIKKRSRLTSSTVVIFPVLARNRFALSSVPPQKCTLYGWNKLIVYKKADRKTLHKDAFLIIERCLEATFFCWILLSCLFLRMCIFFIPFRCRQ